MEGLSDWEKQVYTFAFGEAGAVQCGFCIPGMVISAKGLLDVNPDPTREEAAFAIRNNICRCTGYVKIIDGILLAGKILREEAADGLCRRLENGQPRPPAGRGGKGAGHRPVPRRRVCGRNVLRRRGAQPVRPGRVLSIDVSDAQALPGVVCVLTQKDIPGKVNVGHLKKTSPPLIGVGEITTIWGTPWPDLRPGPGDPGDRQKAGEGRI